jgi:para-nitrobenzyl esterase
MFYEFNYLISTINTSLFHISLKAIIQPMYLRSIILLIFFSFNLDANQVNTSSGITAPEKLKNGLRWNDIPYALPPVGELRWKAPRAFENRQAIILDKENNGCVQEASVYAGVPGSGIVGQEDCLYLDIYTPNEYLNQDLPVMFWIHGGANTSGWKDYYNFSSLATEHNLVVVVVNYRLGPLGWFYHPLIQQFTQDKLDRSSNFGTLDLISALEWVQKNIELFGGNKNNVTIFGESAGGHNVLALLASPLSNNLFHKAIGQSAYTTSYSIQYAHNETGSAMSSQNFLEELKQQTGLTFDSSEELRNISAKTLFEAYKTLDSKTYDYLPITIRDGIVIPEEGLKSALGNSAFSKNIPVMLGTNKDEISLYIGISPYFIKKTYPFTKLIPIPRLKIKDPELYAYWLKVRSDAWKVRGADEPLLQLLKAGFSELYAYRFDWDEQRKSFFADFPSIMGAAHGYEIAFLTNDYKYGPITRYVYPKSKSRDFMGSNMRAIWANFAKTGSPSLKGKIDWPAYNKFNQPFVKLDSTFEIAEEENTLEKLVEGIFNSDVGLSSLQKCLMARDSLKNIGDSLFHKLPELSSGLCNSYDLDEEYRKLERDLIRQYGSLSVL